MFRANQSFKDLLWGVGGYFDLSKGKRSKSSVLVEECEKLHVAHANCSACAGHCHDDSTDADVFDDDIVPEESEASIETQPETPSANPNTYVRIRDMLHNVQVLLNSHPQFEQETIEDIEGCVERLEEKVASLSLTTGSANRVFVDPKSNRLTDKNLANQYDKTKKRRYSNHSDKSKKRSKSKPNH